MKKIGVSLLLLASFVAHSQTVRLIIVADEEDVKFGVTSIADEDLILRMFTNVQGHLDYKLKTTYLNKANFTATQVRATLKKLRTQRSDIVVFYYTGRGYFPENSRSSFPHLQLKDAKSNPLSLDEVAAIVDSKREALGLVIAECRDMVLPMPEDGRASVFENADEDSGVRSMPPPASFSVSEWVVEKVVTQKLFLTNCGVIKLASSQKGHPTFTNRSGTVSAYTLGMTSSYFRMMSSTAINHIDSVSLISLLGNSQVNLPEQEGQRVNVEILPCNESRRRLVKKFPSYANVLSFSDLKGKMNDLVNEEDSTSRAEIINVLRDNFTETATITLKQFEVNALPPKTMEAKDYWRLLATYNPKIKKRGRGVIFASITRTDDLTKITEMEVQERLK